MENERILTVKELTSAVWEKKRLKSVKAAAEMDKEYGTEKLEAQEQLLNFILNLGGVREDVYTYLLTPRFDHVSSVMEIRALLCYAAPAAWIELVVEAINRDAISGLLYADEMIEAYKEGMPLEMVREFFAVSETAFDMCQNRIRYAARHEYKKLHDTESRSEEEKLHDTVSQGEETKLHDIVSRSEKGKSHVMVPESEGRDNNGRMVQNEMSELITGAVMAAMQEFMKFRQCGDSNIALSNEELRATVTQSKKEESRVTAAQSKKEEPYANMPGSEKEEPYANVSGSVKEELRDIMSGSGKEELHDTVTQSTEETDDALIQGINDMPDFPDGKELLENRVTVVDLEKESELHEKRVSFFQLLLNRHLKKSFSKLDEKAQVGKIFEIMVGQKYGKRKILAIRRLMNGGMSKEFIYSLLEKNLSEEELEGLCESLLDIEITEDGIAEDGIAEDGIAEKENTIETEQEETFEDEDMEREA